MIKDYQKRATAKYQKSHYDQIQVRVKIGGKAALQEFAKSSDKSVNAYIIRALRYALADDGADAETIRKICGD